MQLTDIKSIAGMSLRAIAINKNGSQNLASHFYLKLMTNYGLLNTYNQL